MRNVTRHVERLLRQRRPRPFVPTDEEAGVLAAAIGLRAARPEDAVPRAEFLGELRDRLAQRAARTGEDERPPVPWRHRRGLLVGTVASAASATLGVVAGRLLPGRPRSGSASSVLHPASGAWRTVLASADLREGAVARFDTGTVAGFLARDGGTVTARSGVCTHQGCRLNLDQQRLACPCHHTFFRLDGTVITSQLPVPPARLPAIQVREREGGIQVYVPG